MDQNDGHATEATAQHGAAAPDNAVAGFARDARRLAIAALVISVLAPFCIDAIFGVVRIHTPLARRAAETSAAIETLQRRSDDLEKQLAAATAQLTRMQADAARIAANQVLIRRSSLMQLGLALRHTGPFDLELGLVRDTTSDQPALAPLLAKIEPYATTGIPEAGQLQRDFTVMRLKFEWQDSGSTPRVWMNKLIAWQRGLLSREPQEAAPVDPNTQLLRDVSAGLSRDDLPGAIEAARQIDGSRREALSEWIEDAEARVAAVELSRRIDEMVAKKRP